MQGIAPGRGGWLLALGFEGVKACACGASVDPGFPAEKSRRSLRSGGEPSVRLER